MGGSKDGSRDGSLGRGCIHLHETTHTDTDRRRLSHLDFSAGGRRQAADGRRQTTGDERLRRGCHATRFLRRHLLAARGTERETGWTGHTAGLDSHLGKRDLKTGSPGREKIWGRLNAASAPPPPLYWEFRGNMGGAEAARGFDARENKNRERKKREGKGRGRDAFWDWENNRKLSGF